VGQSQLMPNQSLVIPQRIKLDGLIAYETKLAERAWRFSLKIGNLGNTTYRATGGFIQPPRNYTFSSTVSF